MTAHLFVGYQVKYFLKTHAKAVGYSCLSSDSESVSCPVLCDPMHCGSPGALVHGILQARVLVGYLSPSPGDLPNFKPRAPAPQADALASEPSGKPSL